MVLIFLEMLKDMRLEAVLWKNWNHLAQRIGEKEFWQEFIQQSSLLS